MASPIAAAGPSAPSAPDARNAGVATTAAALVGLTFGPSAIAVLSFGVFVRPMEMEFGWSRVQISLAATIVSYVLMLVSPLQGFLTDRWGPRRLILMSIPLFAAGLAAFYFLPSNLPAFYLFWGMLPLLAVGLWPLSYLKAVSGWFDRKLGFALGLANAGVGLGSAIVPVIAGALIAAYGWRTAFAGLGAIVLIVTLPVVFLLLRDPFAGKAAADRPATWGLSFDEAVKQANFRRLVLAFFLLGLSTTALITQQVPMLIDAGWSPQQAASVQAIFGVGLMFGRVGVGYAIDRIFAPRVMAVVAIGGALGCILYATTPNSPLAYVSSALVGLVVGAEFDVLALLLKRYFGTVAFGKLYGVIFAAFQLACGLGIIGLSSLRSQLGSYSIGFFAFAAILTLAAVVFATARPFTYTAAGESAEP